MAVHQKKHDNSQNNLQRFRKILDEIKEKKDETQQTNN